MYLILFLMTLGHFVVDFMIGVWPVYKTLAGIDIAVAGSISAIAAFSGEGLQLFFGFLSDRGHAKKLLFFGLLFSLGSLLLPFGSMPLTWLAFFLMTCMGSGAFHPPAMGLVASLSNTQKSFFVTIFAAGGALGMATSQFIYSRTFAAFEGNVLILAIPTLLLMAGIIFASVKKYSPPPSKKPFSFKEIFSLFKNRELLLLYISQVTHQAIFWAFIFLLPEVCLEKGLDSWVVLGGGHLCLIIGSVCMLVPSGYLADRFSSKSVILCAYIFAMIAFYAFLFFPSVTLGQELILLFILGAAIGVINPLSVAFGHRLYPSSPSLISAFLMGSVWCISEVIGQLGGGMLTKLFEVNPATYALLILGQLLIVGLGACFQMKQPIPSENLVPNP